MSAYSQGALVERQTSQDLGEHGYDVVRSAGSKGAADLVAVHDGEILFVQVKKDKKTAFGPAERRELLRMAARVGAVPLLAYRITDEKDRRRTKIVYRQLTGLGPRDRLSWIPRGVMFDDD